MEWPKIWEQYEGKIVVIEGLIAVGKSVLCKDTYAKLAERDAVPYYPSQEIVDEELVKLFVSNPQSFGRLLQVSCFQDTKSRMQLADTHVKAYGGFAVVDRGLAGNQIFEQTNFILHNLDLADHKFYTALAEHAKKTTRMPDLTLYLDTDITTIIDRIKLRGVGAEKSYDKNYLMALEQAHIKWALISAFQGKPLCIIAYDKFPPPECTVEIVGAFLRAKALGYEWPRVYTTGADVPHVDNMVTALDDDSDVDIMEARASWKKDDVVESWTNSKVVTTAVFLDCDEDPVQCPLFWRKLTYYLMMRVHVIAPCLHAMKQSVEHLFD